MKIDQLKVYGIAESMVASGLPMMAEYDERKFENSVGIIEICTCNDKYYEEVFGESRGVAENHDYKRALKLSSNPTGSGHCNFLSGIVVQCNVTATNAWWLQMERYHFVQIVSSMSKMHRLRQMLESGEHSCFHPKTKNGNIIVEECRVDDDFETLVYNCPMGLELTARISTNYLQLKTIYSQRKDHKLKEWRDFCDWIEGLPFAEFII